MDTSTDEGLLIVGTLVLVHILKEVGLPKRYLSAAVVLIGAAGGLGLIELSVRGAFQGAIAAVTASGGYSLVKHMTESTPAEPPEAPAAPQAELPVIDVRLDGESVAYQTWSPQRTVSTS